MVKKRLLITLLLFSIVLIGCDTEEIDTDHIAIGQISDLTAEKEEHKEEYIPQERVISEDGELKEKLSLIKEPEHVDEETIPKGKEEFNIPECTNQKYTFAPIELADIREISPLGSLNPPGHTIPTEHTYLHIAQEYGGQKIVPLKSPGDIYITAISSDRDDIAPARSEYAIGFSLCRDVHGYFNHVKEISNELRKILGSVECEQWTVNPGNICSKRIFYEAKAGTVLGGVGHKQGNFDFGTYDYRIKHEFINPYRYGFYDGSKVGPATLHKVCPYDYYEPSLKDKIYAKLQNNGRPKCGKTMQDLIGTLQGNWFYGEARYDVPSSWEQQLSFAYEHADPSLATISIGGQFTDTSKWRIKEKTSGQLNRKFSDVKQDGNIYCYEGTDPYIAIDPAKANKAKQEGKIILQLIDDDTLKVEHQKGSCSGSLSFMNPSIYKR